MRTKSASKRVGARARVGIETLHARDFQNDAMSAQPFKVWHPSRLKTGLRNRPIGKKFSM
jgi:hypothetical protein